MAALLLNGAIALMSGWIAEGIIGVRERRRLKASFGSYVSPQVLKQIQSGIIRPRLGGVKMEVCVLFSDIRSFTTRSEHEPPEAIVSLLNLYFTEMTEAIHAHNGTLDKFIGDGILAFFGAPGRTITTPSEDALRSSMEMMARLEKLNRHLQNQGIEPLRIGIGFHYGPVIVGHVGSDSRHEYTIIGDTVNAAARLEGLTKGAGLPILCSLEAYTQLEDPSLKERMQPLGAQSVKGRDAIQVFGFNPFRIPEQQP